MISKRRLLSYALFLIGISLLTGSALYYFHARQPSSELSADNVTETIADLPLVQVITGREAIDSIRQLHGKDFPLAKEWGKKISPDKRIKFILNIY
ncbi:MAG: hypothetical protein WBL25_02035 [Anaerolineales bacterium]